MGQQEVIDTLKNTKEYLTCKQIAEIAGVGSQNIGKSIVVMKKANELKYIERVKKNKNKFGRKYFISLAYQIK